MLRAVTCTVVQSIFLRWILADMARDYRRKLWAALATLLASILVSLTLSLDGNICELGCAYASGTDQQLEPAQLSPGCLEMYRLLGEMLELGRWDQNDGGDLQTASQSESRCLQLYEQCRDHIKLLGKYNELARFATDRGAENQYHSLAQAEVKTATQLRLQFYNCCKNGDFERQGQQDNVVIEPTNLGASNQFWDAIKTAVQNLPPQLLYFARA